MHGTAGIIGALTIGIFASSAVNLAGLDGLLYGNTDQLPIQTIGVGVVAALGFGGTFIIMKVLNFLIGVRVSPEMEDAGLDISEHAERAYAEEEFKLEMDEYVKDLEEKDEFLNKK